MPQYRGIDKEDIFASAVVALGLLQDINPGLATAWDVARLESGILRIRDAQDDKALVTAIREGGAEEILRRYHAIFEYYALVKSDQAPFGFRLYETLSSWGVFQGWDLSAAPALEISERQLAEIESEIDEHLLLELAESVKAEDFFEESPARLRIAQFCDTLDETRPHLGGDIYQAVRSFHELYHGAREGQAYLGQLMPEFIPHMRDAFFAMRGLDLNRALLQDMAPFMAYRAVPDAAVNGGAWVCKEYMRQFLNGFRVSGDIITLTQEQGEDPEVCPDLIFTGTEQAAIALKKAFPGVVIVDQNGRQVLWAQKGSEFDWKPLPRPPSP